MKTSKITRTFVFVLGAIAAADSVEGAVPVAGNVNVVGSSRMDVVSNDQIAPTGTIRLTTGIVSGVDAVGADIGTTTNTGEAVAHAGWIGVDPEQEPWDGTADGQVLDLQGGSAKVEAVGRFVLDASAANKYVPHVPGIVTGVKLQTTSTATDIWAEPGWSVAGGSAAATTGKVQYAFGTGNVWSTVGGLADAGASGKTVQMEIANTQPFDDASHNQLFQGAELVIPDTCASTFTCTGWKLDGADDTGMEGVLTAELRGVAPIRARVQIANGQTCAANFAGFGGSYLVVEGANGATNETINLSDGLPQSHITLRNKAKLTLGTATTADNSVVDLRGCSGVTGTSLTLGAHSRLIF